MQTPVFDFPVFEFCWYGIVSILSLLCFASLSYEVRRALEAARQAENEMAHEVAHEVAIATYNVNFLAMVVANIALIVCCSCILGAHGDAWRSWFAGSIFTCGAYWFYTRACEKKLILFLQTAGVYSQTAPTSRMRLFKRTS